MHEIRLQYLATPIKTSSTITIINYTSIWYTMFVTKCLIKFYFVYSINILGSRPIKAVFLFFRRIQDFFVAGQKVYLNHMSAVTKLPKSDLVIPKDIKQAASAMFNPLMTVTQARTSPKKTKIRSLHGRVIKVCKHNYKWA